VTALATADPPVHALHRSTVFPELVAKRMTMLDPDIAELADDCSRLIGFRDADIDQLLSAAFDSTAMLGSALTFDELMELITRIGEIQAWIFGQVAAARPEPGSDILGTVARGVNDGVFGEFEANAILHTLLSAGGESTTSLLGNAVRLLAERQDLQQQLRRNPDQIPRFVEEALRLEPPFRYHMRYVPKDTTLGGVDIPAEATVLLLWGAANRDAAEFERPDEVDLHRQVPRLHMAFGRGIHHCVGAPLARIEARILLTVLLERTSSITLDPERPPRWVKSLMVRRHEQLPVRLSPADAPSAALATVVVGADGARPMNVNPGHF
jgi:cytochrome P450